MSAPRPALPLASTVVALGADGYEILQRTVSILFRLAHGDAFAARVDDGADVAALHRAGNFGVFMGYDFHVTAAGPRLIEVNTNAGGALVNGLHTASRIDPGRLDCLCSGLLPVETVEARILAMFRAEIEAARPGARLESIDIEDECPEEQFLRAEFELFRELFERAGIRAAVADTSALRRDAGGLFLGDRRIDLVYLRDTDFRLSAPRSQALREAWLAGEVVVTPSPREHHLLADKRRLVIFSSESALRELGLSQADAAFLSRVVPQTIALADLGRDEAWRTRRVWVFKPAGAFGSRAVYRGDKITRTRFEEIWQAGDFVAQRNVAPGEIDVSTVEGPRRMKFDVRAYAYREEILLLGARVYQGQVTNMRTPGGGFSAICVVRRPEAVGVEVSPHVI
jgi:hypothetical protein